MSDTVTLDRYAQALHDHVAHEAQELPLLHAYELGRALVEEGAGLLDVARLHADAVALVEATDDVQVSPSRADSFLIEVLSPFEMAYLGFQEANSSLRQLTASLEEQVAQRTRQLQESLSALQATDAERRRLLARLVAAQEHERHRLAEDLHDDTIQVMTAAALRIGGLRTQMASDDQALLDRLEGTVTDAIARLRRLVFELRPLALDREGLAAAVRLYLREAFDEGRELVVDDRLEEQPPVETREIIYRIVQEALANVRKHARARRIEVVFDSHRGGVRASVVDDGRGFDPHLLDTAHPGHLGVSAMRERAAMAGGWCAIDSRPGQGTTVSCWIPLADDSDAAG